MSEEMEKKTGTRPSSVPPKANGSESKKNDNGTPKQYQKYGKRREYSGNRPFQENNSPRKPTPQKAKILGDKRPRSRGSYGYRQRDDVVEEYEGDFESALHSGTKKVNLNHLLNFSYAGRQSYSDRPRWSSNRERPRRGSRVNFNKEQFLQANCQFIVKEDGDYTVHSIDPDILVDWGAVELVRVKSHELPSCPICLEHPKAAKITRCGHIYCWACILHYLTLGEKTWRKCPICYEAVHDKDLKSVITQEAHHYKVGETITMQLMKREKGTTHALPKSCWVKGNGVLSNLNVDPKKASFMKLLSASKEDVRRFVLEPERSALQRQFNEAETSEVPFIESAFQALKHREDELNGKIEVEHEVKKIIDKATTESERKTSESDKRDSVGSTTASSVNPGKAFDGSKKVKQYASAFSDEEDETVDIEPAKEVDDIPSSPTTSEPHSPTEDIPKASIDDSGLGAECEPPLEEPQQMIPVDLLEDSLPVDEAAEYLELPSSYTDSKIKPSEEAFYYYQAADGQQIYLHALNARCLVKEYGGLEYSPDTITATIVQIENIFMTEDLRKRLRYLGHLPLTCEFEVVELALKQPILSKDTIRCFSDEIDRRRRLRQKKKRDERRWTKQIQDEERKRFGMKSSDSVIVKSQFMTSTGTDRPASPAARSDDSSQSTSSLISPVGSPLDLDINLSTSPGNDDGQQTSSLSFAQMLKGGSSKTVWPKINKPATVEEPKKVSKTTGSDESDSEDKVPVPVFGHSFGDAIQTALDQHEKSKDEASNMVSLTQRSGGKKKKKQQKLLFATTMARGGN